MAGARPIPRVHADLAATSALAATHEQRPAPVVEMGFGEGQRFLDAQPGPPEDDDQATQASPVRAVAGRAHDGDDLLNFGRIGGIAETLFRGGRPAWKPGMVAGERRRPARSSSISDIAPPQGRERDQASVASTRSVSEAGARPGRYDGGPTTADRPKRERLAPASRQVCDRHGGV